MISLQSNSLDEDPKLKKQFNSGKFARTNYRRLYHLRFNSKGASHEVKSPSLRQIFYSWRLLRKAVEGTPYERHGHPVMMLNFNIAPSTPAKVKVLAERERRLYGKSNQKRKRNKK